MSEAAMVKGAIAGFRSFVDGGGSVTLHFNQVEWKIFRANLEFDIHGEVAVAALGSPGSAQKPPSPPKGEPDYGAFARALRLSVFMGTPEVWKAVGSDESFLAWVRLQKCCARSGKPCSGPIEAAHVWRLAAGAGKGVKPPYSAVAFCHEHHRLQHQHGESEIGGRDYMELQARKHREGWLWESLKDELGYTSMADVPPHILISWSEKHGIAKFLPEAFREISLAE